MCQLYLIRQFNLVLAYRDKYLDNLYSQSGFNGYSHSQLAIDYFNFFTLIELSRLWWPMMNFPEKVIMLR